ncbi:MAG TPA: alginate export family protein [Thermoanaerobaculia bacterium]|jgi:hypothetical protein|nr:alginate export family protein [Thermoanaerobaculia bacterium]
MRNTLFAVILLLASPVAAAPPEIKPSFDLRLRWEGFDTPARNAATDPEYDLGLARFRAGLDLIWTRWKLHGMVQAGGVFNIPENGAFAAGPTYFAANRGTDVGVIGLAELYAAYEAEGLKLVLGRQPYADGMEVPTGVAHLDGVKRRRLSDRLVGTFEWPNTARRFDGASFGYGPGSTHVAVFGFRPLVGAFDSSGEAFEEIGDVTVYGATVTGKHGQWIPGTEVRIFTVQYEDERRVARGELSLNTSGASFLLGNATTDLLLWGALQTGDWGLVDQDAWAFLVDVGRRFDNLPGKPAFHLAWEQSSGDPHPTAGDHETFFNVLPTNHKFYGSMDYLALQNLRDLYVESLLGIGPKLKVRAMLHDFALTEQADVWYGGSGAFEEESFGYAGRLALYPSKDLARELDVEVTWPLQSGFELGIGGGHWWGGEAAETFFPAEKDGNWLYLQLGWKN